ncbi:MAG: ABC transporter substrate-binding protein [Armatimonadota bacterium]|nr:ABC transporter substrate-binding protein [Armatimonadota bacterium]
MRRTRAVLFGSILLLALLAVPAGIAAPKKEVKIAIGPPAVVGYLPVYVAQGLRYFQELARRTGIQVRFLDFRGGTEAATALITGDVDFATVTLTHVVKAQEKGKDLKFLLTFFNAQAMAMIVQPDVRVETPTQLQGMRIGVTSLGSATHMQARHILRYFKANPDAAQYIAVGGPSTALAAWKRRAVDAMVYLDPLVTTLVSEGSARLFYDVRTVEGTVRLYGAPYISSGLLTRADVIVREPRLVQEIVNVFVRTLRWLRAQRLRPEVIAGVLPKELGWTPEVIRANLSGLSADGRVLPEAVETVVRSLVDDGLLSRDFKPSFERLVDQRFVQQAILSVQQ